VPAPDLQPFSGRLHALQAYLEARTLHALLVSTPQNITYLTGFKGSAGLLIVSAASAFLLVDGRYERAVQEGIFGGRLVPLNVVRVNGRYDETLRDVLTREGFGRVGFEAEHVTVALLATWHRTAVEVTFEPTRGVVEGQRMIKDAGEIATFRQGATLLADVLGMLPTIVRRGRSEQEVAIAIDAALVHSGFDRPSFETIVASGPNSALPHARPSGRQLTAGDLVVLDFGGALGGYCLDLTRMAAVGQVTASAMALFESVREANAAAVRAVRPGARASDVDRSPATCSMRKISVRRFCTPPAMASVSRSTNHRGWASLTRTLPSASKPAWSSRSNRARTSAASVESGWRTMCS
jgi:Xaa-Pro aminopeptidase